MRKSITLDEALDIKLTAEVDDGHPYVLLPEYHKKKGEWGANAATHMIRKEDITRIQRELIGDWQPIETAPKDEVIDLWCNEYLRITDCWWDDGWIGGPDVEYTHWKPITQPLSPEIEK